MLTRTWCHVCATRDVIPPDARPRAREIDAAHAREGGNGGQMDVPPPDLGEMAAPQYSCGARHHPRQRSGPTGRWPPSPLQKPAATAAASDFAPAPRRSWRRHRANGRRRLGTSCSPPRVRAASTGGDLPSHSARTPGPARAPAARHRAPPRLPPAAAQRPPPLMPPRGRGSGSAWERAQRASSSLPSRGSLPPSARRAT
jgi:hypothetical protein